LSRLLLVCRANLCRSPMAEIVYRDCAPQLGLTQVASAGVWAHAKRLAMDARARAALERRRYAVDKRWKSTLLTAASLRGFDRVLAADAKVMAGLQQLWPDAPPRRLQLLMDLIPGREGEDLPDPYYADAPAFEQSLDLIEQSVRGYLTR
jgi:protein-tyrosine phosphatase